MRGRLDAGTERGKTLVLRLPAHKPEIDLGNDDRHAEQAERLVEVNGGQVAPAVFGVVGDQFLAPQEAVVKRHHRQRAEMGRIVGQTPPRQQRAQVGKGIAERTHIPVEHGNDAARIVAVQHDVVQLVVVVDQRRRALRRLVAPQPVIDRVHRRQLLQFGRLPAPPPPLDLSADEAGRPAQIP